MGFLGSKQRKCILDTLGAQKTRLMDGRNYRLVPLHDSIRLLVLCQSWTLERCYPLATPMC